MTCLVGRRHLRAQLLPMVQPVCLVGLRLLRVRQRRQWPSFVEDPK